MANLTGKGGWKKGQSGNPDGRPAIPKAIKKIGPKAFKNVWHIAEHGESEKIRLEANLAIVAYVYGKAPQPVTDANGNNISGGIVYIQLPVKDTGNGEKA